MCKCYFVLRPSLITQQAEEEASSTSGSSFASVIASFASPSLASSSFPSSSQVSSASANSEIACERCKRSVLANGARRRDPRLGRAPWRSARKLVWAAAWSSSSPPPVRARSVGAEHAEAEDGERWWWSLAPGGRRARGRAVARHAGRRGAGRRLRAERRAHAPLPTAAARPRGGCHWVVGGTAGSQ